MASYSVSVKALVAHNSGSAQINTPELTSTTPAYQITRQTLANGDNTITPPTGATIALIIFDSASSTVKKLKGAAGDTGITIISTQIMLPVSAAFIINSSGADSSVTEIIFL